MKPVEDVRGQKQWLEMVEKFSVLISLFKTLKLLYFKLKIDPIRIRAETLMPSGDTQGTHRSRHLRLISTPRLGKLSTHTIITSDTHDLNPSDSQLSKHSPPSITLPFISA